MKIKLVFSIALAIMALALVACTPAGKEVPVTVTYDEFNQQKNVTRNAAVTRRDTLTVTLPSNPGTGFRWELIGISDLALLQKAGDSEYILPESSVIGAYGQEIWTFKPLQRGTSGISLEYSQPWEGGTKKEWMITIEVKIR